MLYSMLYIFGYKDFTQNALQNLRQLKSITSGHPEINPQAGIEVTTGPLGEGIAMGVGMAIGESILNARYSNVIDNYTFVFSGDGCLMEGVSFEALSLAGTLKLSKLIVIYDKNNITIDGNLDITNTEDIAKRMESLGFEVMNINGHDYAALQTAIHDAKLSDCPSFIIANTKIAYLAGNKEDSPKAHGEPLGRENIEILKEKLQCDAKPFCMSSEVKDFAHEVLISKLDTYKNWCNKVQNNKEYQKFLQNDIKELNEDAIKALIKLANEAISKQFNIATRACSGKVLEVLTQYLPNLIGGSADLSQSNNTIHGNSIGITPTSKKGNYIHYGVREHAMGAIMNGLSCSNFIPYGGTFLVFSDFMRPAIRLSALMKKQVWYIFTHDNISLGGDGPTHQPIEQIESLRLIPNVQLLRPCDLVETIEAYQIALQTTNKPTILIFGRSAVPTLRNNFDYNKNLVKYGGYVLQDCKNAKVNLVSSGSELHLCVEVANKLNKAGINTRVISMPSLDIFSQQSGSYKQEVLGKTKNIVVQAGNATGWKEALSDNTVLYDIKTFGESGSPDDVMDYFGFNVSKILHFVKTSV